METDKKIQLLLIEDDDVDREAVHRLLGGGYDVRDAATGQHALDLFRRSRFDSVLLDYRLPDTDGMKLLSFFAREQVPVVMLTGEESPEVIVEAMKQGAQDYLVKGDLTRAALEYAIKNAIEKMSLRRALDEKQRKLEQQARALEKSNRQVRTLASALALAEQQERRRISQVLHDHLQQNLYGVKIRAKLLRAQAPEAARALLAPHLEEIVALLDDAIATTRTLSVELYTESS